MIQKEKRYMDITGERYGRLTVLRFDHWEKGNSYWLCRCDCGNEKVVKRYALREGKCRSCGCLRKDAAAANGARRKGRSVVKVQLVERQIKWLVVHFKHTKNADIVAKLGISDSTLHRLARKHGLTKSAQFRRKVQEEAAGLAHKALMAQDAYIPKGYVIPRSEEFAFKPGHRESKRTRKRRLAKSMESMRRTRKLERARLMFGLPQQTRLCLTKEPKRKTAQRYKLRQHGYIIERGGDVAYYDENTVRLPYMENRTKADRYYTYFQYLPISEKKAQ